MSRAIIVPLLLMLAAAQELVAQAPQPIAGPPPRLTLPKVDKALLPNGLRLDVVPMREIPLVQATLIVDGGGRLDGNRPGLASVTASMLDEGAGSLDALQLSEALEHLGATLSVGATWDATTLVMRAPRRTFPEALNLLADVVLRSRFAAPDIARERDLRLAQLLQQRDQPNAVATVVLGRALYPEGHPYAAPISGDSASVASFDSASARNFWNSVADPRRATLIVAGDLTPAEARSMVQKALGEWRGSRQPAPRLPQAPSTTQPTTRIVLVDKPGSPQSVIVAAVPGVSRRSADYPAITLMNTILGGTYSARLNDVLREQKGYSYGAFSQFVWRPLPGPFLARAAVRSDVTDSSLAVVLAELARIRDQPVSDAELQRAKQYIELGALGQWETTGDVTAQLATLHAFGLPASTVTRDLDAIRALSTADVQRAARTYIDPSHLTIVIVGDVAKIRPEIEAMKVGTIEVRDVEGRVREVEGTKS